VEILFGAGGRGGKMLVFAGKTMIIT